MIKKYTSFEDVAYSEDTRKVVMNLYKDEIVKSSIAAHQVIIDLMHDDRISRDALKNAIVSIVAGIFVVGFKAGNDFFMDEADEKNEKKT